MAIEELDAIVMRSYPLRDTSRIVHLLARQRGHLKVVAKGARGPRSRFGAALEPFTRISAVVYYRLHRDLQLLSQAEITDRRRVLGRSLLRFAYASAVIELLEQFLGGEEASPPLFQHVDTTLTAFEQLPEPVLRLAFMGFAVRLLALQGYRPELQRCVACKRGLEGRLLFDAARGGIVCPRCAGAVVGGGVISEAARQALSELLEPQRQPGAALPAALGDELARLLDAFLRAHVPRYRRLRSLELVRAAQPRE